MGKDQNGTFHPGKGKPSGINKEEGLGLEATKPQDMNEYLEISDKYIDGEDELAGNVQERHPNRNTSKGEEAYKGKENTSESDKSDNETFTEESTGTQAEELPGVLTKERFTELANYKAGIAVSLYIPTHQFGVEVNERFDQVAFKTTLNTVEQQLKERGLNEEMVQTLLKPGHGLEHNDDFWIGLSNALAVFIADGFFKYIKMPVTTEKKIVIESTFYVTPLLPIMTNSNYFYLLVISKQTPKLFKADSFGMQIVPVKVPQGVHELKTLSDMHDTTFRRGDSGRRANPVALTGEMHGTGGGNPDNKDLLVTYFQAVDDILWEKVLHNENAPLLLAGVEYEIPIYRSVCDYQYVWEQSLTGNRERQDTKSLYQEAKELMKPYFEQQVNKALEVYGNKSATALTSSIVADVIPAAYYGKISHLFVCKGFHVWGTFDEMANKITIDEAQQESSEDLIDNAVVKTLATGGEVFLLDKERMPADSSVAALFRY